MKQPWTVEQGIKELEDAVDSNRLPRKEHMDRNLDDGQPWLDLRGGLIVGDERHPATKHMAPLFRYTQLPPELRAVSSQFAIMGQFLVDHLLDGPELTVALRSLWDAKNSAVVHAGFMNGLNPANPIPHQISNQPTQDYRTGLPD
jgi:hypothetical protein